MFTSTTWWPAWESAKRGALHKMRTTKEPQEDIAKRLERICELARDPNVQVWLPDEKLDVELWPALRFFKEIFCLKELPRHGFALFGMKRNETDSFAPATHASTATSENLDCCST